MIHYCDHHSGTLASSPDRLNPYKLGIELFRDIEERWNTGRFGKEYDECDDFDSPAELEPRHRPGPAEDFRSPPDSQRSDVHRRIPDARFLPPVQAVFVRLQPGQQRLRDRKPRISRDQAATAVQPDQRRPAADRGARRQLQEPRRIVSGTPIQRRRAQNQLGPRHAGQSVSSVEPARAHRNRSGRDRRRSCPSTAPNRSWKRVEIASS